MPMLHGMACTWDFSYALATGYMLILPRGHVGCIATATDETASAVFYRFDLVNRKDANHPQLYLLRTGGGGEGELNYNLRIFTYNLKILRVYFL